MNDFGANQWLIDQLRAQYQQDPTSVDPAWAAFFQSEAAQISQAQAPIQPAPPAAQAPTPARTEPPAPAHSTAPSQPGDASKVTKAVQSKPSATAPQDSPEFTKLRGAPMRTAQNMEESLATPTATSVREIPMKLAIDQREIINSYLAATIGGKVSFTHLIAYAMIQAMKAIPEMNVHYEEVDGKPYQVSPKSINLGIAIDLTKDDGTRQLLVPNIKHCEDLDFAAFWRAYEALIKKARAGKLEVDDFSGTTCSITNPGGIGTTHSVPRLMPGQSVILGVGAIAYPPEFQGTSKNRINELGVSKVTTLTSTYDHRVIQGAQSGEFLKAMNELLLGEHEFYDKIFCSLRVPYTPIRWTTDTSDEGLSTLPRGARLISLIDAYRTWGHFMADIDPLEYRQRSHPQLAIEKHGLTLWDLDRVFGTGDFGGVPGHATMREILKTLRSSYCRTIGVEYMHISNDAERQWVQNEFESVWREWTRDEYLRILDKLIEAEVFETFLQTKYVGQKRFSLEGGESAIVALDEICELAADNDLEEVTIGMPHRGRLNVLANIVGKSYAYIFQEFEGNADLQGADGSGDVKYHLGAEGLFSSPTGKSVWTSLAANPSHLEAVDPVLEGIARAKLDALDDTEQAHEFPILPVLIHGDAAFAGQGVVYETMQMAQLRAYRNGGTIHLVINNQVGFTTAPIEGRSSIYCTDVAKSWECPIFHVNGDNPAAVARVARLAFEFRQRFHKDAVIDMVCYRRRGHNEGDDPSFTQPAMYDLIEAKPTVRTIFTESLVGRGDITEDDAAAAHDRFRSRLESVFEESRRIEPGVEYTRSPKYPPKRPLDESTSTTPEVLEKVAKAHLSFPPGFTVHPKVLSVLERRAKSIREGGIDWATGELLAIGSLLLEGRPVRLVGQDTRRGTFSQRFAAVIDRVTSEAYVPLKHLSAEQGRFCVYDSLLSEYAALGFEYGYSVAAPNALVLWEAQFGDFVNGAQTITDEFVSSGMAKWQQKSGVVLLLPHGQEGQGPDHSSARLERWLNLCSEQALAVAQPSTPASYFHLLRRHAYVHWHRPVVIATPKSMLRNKLAVSQPADFTTGSWRAALADPTITDPGKVSRVLLCSGKIRWELVKARTAAGKDGQIAIIPLERLYPLPTEDLSQELQPYSHVTDFRFVQEEASNQGAWRFMKFLLEPALSEKLGRQIVLQGITREAASAPAVGSMKLYQSEESALLKAALE